MMDIARVKISKQLYDKAMDNYYKGDLEKALTILNQAAYKSNDSLNFQIESKKYPALNEAGEIISEDEKDKEDVNSFLQDIGCPYLLSKQGRLGIILILKNVMNNNMVIPICFSL